jgi:hypothetical protein
MDQDRDQRDIFVNRGLETNLNSSLSCEMEFRKKDLSPWVFGFCVVGGVAVYEGCNLIHQYSPVIKPIINTVCEYLGFR